MLSLWIAVALADIAPIDPCDAHPREVCANDGSICPTADPACGQLLANDGWTRFCASPTQEIWCAPTSSSSLCATTSLAPPTLGLALLALAVRRRATAR